MKRLVVLTADGLAQRYVVNRLCDRFDVAAIFLDVKPKAGFLRRLRRYNARVAFLKILRSLYLAIIRDEEKANHAIRKVLGREFTEGFHRQELVRRVQGLNNPMTRRILKEIAPDLLLVYGCSVVSERTLAIAKDIALNMHTGISPYYRGTLCTLWPVVNQELEMLGATVHECTSAIDGGQIFSTRRARLESSDGIHELFARTVQVGSEIYNDVVQEYLEGRLSGVPQDHSIGREYRAYMQTLWPEIRARRLIKKGLVRRFVSAGTPTSEMGEAARRVE